MSRLVLQVSSICWFTECSSREREPEYNRFGGPGSMFERYKRSPDGRHVGDEVRKKIIAWDTAPGEDYFKELFRVSRNQIIWGGNYFRLPPTRCFLVWRKLTISEKFTMAMAEYAWTSFNSNAKVFEHVPQDNTGQRFHPTQKPVALYAWIFVAHWATRLRHSHLLVHLLQRVTVRSLVRLRVVTSGLIQYVQLHISSTSSGSTLAMTMQNVI